MRVTVGVSGGIAAYKAAELVRALQRQALEVHVVMTEAATKFVQPLTFAVLTGHKVITSLWDDTGTGNSTYNEQNGIEHISEAQWADALVVAPATANILAKFAHGIADDFLSTLYLATPAPVLVAPTMNVKMWEHPATQANLEILRQRGVRVIEPGTGDLACGMVGAGRMAEPAAIADAVLCSLGRCRDLAGEVLLVTAGGTREALDPVRFLGNRSSGKMGYALADAAQSRGAKVILISGPSALHPPANCEVVKVTTADQMREAVLGRMNEATLLIKAAAVSDYRPVSVSAQKLKRSGPLTLELAPTERPYTDPYEYCPWMSDGTCGACIQRCPVNAIHPAGKDHRVCITNGDTNIRPEFKEWGYHSCGHCQNNLPCSDRIPKRKSACPVASDHSGDSL